MYILLRILAFFSFLLYSKYVKLGLNRKGGELVLESAKSTFEKMSKSIGAKFKNVSYNAVLGTLIGLAIAVFVIDNNVKANMIYMVKVNDKLIGYVQSEQACKKALTSIRETDGSDPLSSVLVQKTSGQSDKFINDVELERAIRKELNLKMPALAVYADNVEIVKVDSKETLDKVLQGVKEYYYPKIEGGSYTITSSNIKESITTSSIIASPDEILDCSEAVEKIVNGKGAKQIYTIKEKDTMWDIAIKNGLSIEDIEDANPDINMEKLKIGQVINLAVNLPYINVEIVANVKAKEAIPFDTEKVEDKSIAKGTTQVKKEGRDGLAEVEKNLVILNGEVKEEEVLSNKVLTAAADKIVVVGEKEKQVVASGSFMRPSRGSISSNFGRRWGRAHKGVDIAGPTGSPIYAADGGTVSFAGWSNGYGLCVIINHGNGYQTLYGHSSKLLVKAGQKVSKGERIANVGSTGRSTGPHLHFEVRINGAQQNPLKYIK